MPKQKSMLGFIGGSGLYNLEDLKNVEEISVTTPFGQPSDKIITGILEGKRIAFLPRHGRGHRFLPSEVNYRANIYALKKIGVNHIVSVSAVGSLQEKFAPGSIIIPNQILDFTKGRRASTFFGEGIVGHVGFAHPFCEKTRHFVRGICENLKLNCHFGGTSVCVEGPRFSSKAESHYFRARGGDIIGMTAMPEAMLAREAEIPYVNVSFVTDFDCWREGEEAVNVEMVIATLHKNAHIAKTLTAQIAKEFPEETENEIFHAASAAIMTAQNLIPAETQNNLQLLYGKYWKMQPTSSPARTLQSLQYTRGSLQVLNQLLLPHTHRYEDAGTCARAHHAIQSMKVRGAPLIAITAALALAVELENLDKTSEVFESQEDLRHWIHAKLDFLVTSRPTAVNLFQMSAHIKNILAGTESSRHVNEVRENIIDACEQYYQDDRKINRSIGRHGAQIFDTFKRVNILTHCNTGSLATSDYGTALGVIRALSENNKLNHTFCTETRPYNQGARLTAYELVYEKIPSTLVADSMASFLMQTKKLDAVIVGADRIAANGDTANKIGTYQLAISAFYHKVPFFVAAPTTSFDCGIASGADIKIEERPMHELTHVGNVQIAASDIGVWNPSFDITPAHLISGFIHEHGVVRQNNGGYHFTSEQLQCSRT